MYEPRYFVYELEVGQVLGKKTISLICFGDIYINVSLMNSFVCHSVAEIKQILFKYDSI